MNQRYSDDHTKGYEVYLHERDQFWPGIEMERIGQTNKMYIPLKTEVWGSFTSVHKTNLYKESTPCIRDNEYSFTYCMKNYLAATAGCHLDWAETKRHTMRKHNPCVTWEEVRDYCLLSSGFVLLWSFSEKGTT